LAWNLHIHYVAVNEGGGKRVTEMIISLFIVGFCAAVLAIILTAPRVTEFFEPNATAKNTKKRVTDL
jgi:hypothetical protein